MSNFDSWNLQKKNIDADIEPLKKFPKVGEVWITILGKNIGFEQNGSGDIFLRPVLIIAKFNNHMFWAVPLSSKQKSFDFYFNFEDPSQKHVALILAQLRLISVKRLQRRMYELPNETLQIVKMKLKNFL